MRPTVTIGVCVRNCEASIKKVINNILDQDFPHESMELIIVDDGSEDMTLSIVLNCISRLDMRVKVYQQKWKGLGPARNVVVYNTSGDYIVWVDGDMVIPRDYVRKQVEFMERNPAVGIASGRTKTRPEENLVATLEVIGFLAKDFKNRGVASQKIPGTAGSIYRVKAIRHVGGFDSNIKGAGEDIDAGYRIREAGWLIYLATDAIFYAKRKETWKALLSQYFWHGYGGHYVLHKNRGMERLYEMLPPAAFLEGILYSITAYKLIHRKVVFLLPLQFIFKMTAWCLGFVRSHMNSYGHTFKTRINHASIRKACTLPRS